MEKKLGEICDNILEFNCLLFLFLEQYKQTAWEKCPRLQACEKRTVYTDKTVLFS